MSGLMAQTGAEDGPPTMVGEAIADVAGGLFAAWGVMVALFERSRTGRGRIVDLALFDALISMMPTAGARVLVCDDDPTRTGNRHALSAPFGVYPAGTGHFAVAVLNDKLFAAFCAAIGRSELVGDPRFATDELRRRNEPALGQAIMGWAHELSAEATVEVLSGAGVPAAVLATTRQAWQSQQVRERGLATEVSRDGLGAMRLPEQPVHFSGVRRGGGGPAPSLDQDGAAIRARFSRGRP